MKKKEFLNYEQMYDALLRIYKDVASDYDYDYSCECEEYAEISASSFVSDMDKYVHQDSTRIYGNFCDIEEDWNITTCFIVSDVKPWGRFRDVVKSIDNGTISDDDLQKFQQWCFDWFFTAFGTYNLRYNFGEALSNLEYERERFEELYAA